MPHVARPDDGTRLRARVENHGVCGGFFIGRDNDILDNVLPSRRDLGRPIRLGQADQRGPLGRELMFIALGVSWLQCACTGTLGAVGWPAMLFITSLCEIIGRAFFAMIVLLSSGPTFVVIALVENFLIPRDTRQYPCWNICYTATSANSPPPTLGPPLGTDFSSISSFAFARIRLLVAQR